MDFSSKSIFILAIGHFTKRPSRYFVFWNTHISGHTDFQNIFYLYSYSTAPAILAVGIFILAIGHFVKRYYRYFLFWNTHISGHTDFQNIFYLIFPVFQNIFYLLIPSRQLSCFLFFAFSLHYSTKHKKIVKEAKENIIFSWSFHNIIIYLPRTKIALYIDTYIFMRRATQSERIEMSP